MDIKLSIVNSKKWGFSKLSQAGFWATLGFGGLQVLRLLSHLILARLLIPADFGLMQLVFVFLQGFGMFSDLGIWINVVQHPRGEETSFLRTAWTIQILRGAVIFLFSIIVAWPISKVYLAPNLVWLLPLGGFFSFVDSLSSMRLALLERYLDQRRLTYLDLGTQFIGLIIMIGAAVIWQAVWTLLVSFLVTSFLRTGISHFYFSGPTMKLAWDRQAALEVVRFGQWIFLGSIFGFFVNRLDKLIFGYYASLTDLGLYGIAGAFCAMVLDLVGSLTTKVMLPYLAEIKRTSRLEIHKAAEKLRAYFFVCALPPLLLLGYFSSGFMSILYPANYANGSWMLQVLAFGACGRLVGSSMAGGLFFSMGDSLRALLALVFQTVILVIFMLIGHHFGGVKGLVVGAVFTEFVNYPLLAYLLHPFGLWTWKVDFIAFFFILIAAYLTFIV